MRQNSLHKKHIREGITNSLVDEVCQSTQGLKRISLCWRLGFLGLECLQSLLREHNSSVAIGFEVHADIKFRGCVVQPFDASGSANYWQAKRLLDIFCR